MNRPKSLCSALLALGLLLTAAAPAAAHDDGARRRADNAPLVIGHRGGATATCPTTRWRAMRSASSWAPTTSSPTWSPPRTAT